MPALLDSSSPKTMIKVELTILGEIIKKLLIGGIHILHFEA